MGTDWGLTGNSFIVIAVVIAAVLAAASAVVRMRHRSGVTATVRLTDEELGQLVGGAHRAVMVAVGNLRRHGVLAADARRQLTVTAGAGSRTVLQEAIVSAVLRGLDGGRLSTDREVLWAAAALRTTLAERGLVLSRERRAVLVGLVAAGWLLWITGAVLVVVGVVQGELHAGLVLWQAVLAAVLWGGARIVTRQRSAEVDRLLQDVRRCRIAPGTDEAADHRFGERVVLAGVTGVPIALGGVPALSAIDPMLARAVSTHRPTSPGWEARSRPTRRSSDAGWGGGGTVGCSFSSGCGSASGGGDGGGSSSCGGGCGGGGGD